jgi:hypothetical protein
VRPRYVEWASINGTAFAYGIARMPPRRAKPQQIPHSDVRALLKKTEKLCNQSAKVRAQARDGLISHFQHESEMLPIAADQERRARMARKQR